MQVTYSLAQLSDLSRMRFLHQFSVHHGSSQDILGENPFFATFPDGTDTFEILLKAFKVAKVFAENSASHNELPLNVSIYADDNNSTIMTATISESRMVIQHKALAYSTLVIREQLIH